VISERERGQLANTKYWLVAAKNYDNVAVQEVRNIRERIAYLVMARIAGLRSNYVSVEVNYLGHAVNHACAAVFVSGANVLVDVAYTHSMCTIRSTASCQTLRR
jgi:hypothetical protein